MLTCLLFAEDAIFFIMPVYRYLRTPLLLFMS